uniref:Ig-like domain-containing protein n=1 Tax=Callorhinchus milii TaxID=7868 RepID=A0A4W3GTT6_CALMI
RLSGHIVHLSRGIEQLFYFLVQEFTVSGPALPVPAIAGSDVVLDCKCSTHLSLERLEVRWFRTRFDSPVREQDTAYRHRTGLFVEEIMNGNVSLRLQDVQVSDNGTYTCYDDYEGWYQEAQIQLHECVREIERGGGREEYL